MEPEPKWEYITRRFTAKALNPIDWLNEQGRVGWELVGCLVLDTDMPIMFVLKRRLWSVPEEG
jgi:hypothetical protein